MRNNLAFSLFVVSLHFLFLYEVDETTEVASLFAADFLSQRYTEFLTLLDDFVVIDGCLIDSWPLRRSRLFIASWRDNCVDALNCDWCARQVIRLTLRPIFVVELFDLSALRRLFSCFLFMDGERGKIN